MNPWQATLKFPSIYNPVRKSFFHSKCNILGNDQYGFNTFNKVSSPFPRTTSTQLFSFSLLCTLFRPFYSFLQFFKISFKRYSSFYCNTLPLTKLWTFVPWYKGLYEGFYERHFPKPNSDGPGPRSTFLSIFFPRPKKRFIIQLDVGMGLST